MTVSRGLLGFMWRQALPATILGGACLGLYTVVYPKVMTFRDVWPALFLYVQCVLLAILLGNYRTPAFAFLHSRGYSRNTLWGHLMLTSGLSILASWLPTALIVWSGLRSFVRDRMFRSPYFPVMGPLENHIPLVWLTLALLFITSLHYVWIRHAQPTRRGGDARLMVAGILAAVLVAYYTVHHFGGWFGWLTGGLYVLVVTCLIWGGRVMYRSVEVRA